MCVLGNKKFDIFGKFCVCTQGMIPCEHSTLLTFSTLWKSNRKMNQELKSLYIKNLYTINLSTLIKTSEHICKNSEKNTKNIRARNWTSAEVTLFAKVFTYEEHNFAASLEERTLKRAANNEAFTLSNKYLTINVRRIIL